MRIRIVQKPPIQDVDGIAVDCFDIGREYEVGNSLGALMLAEGWAEPVPLDAPRPFTPFGPDDPFDSRVLYRDDADAPPNLKRDREPPYVDRDLAADFRWRKKAGPTFRSRDSVEVADPAARQHNSRPKKQRGRARQP
jgi:hypothetical protein